ncbi:pbs lyase heat-like repeat domain protein : PBS lyase HEAT-like repeat domain protein OS=Rhodopirellula sp. SWK7 GN=RRSWK_06263 PE=4 SV=1: HEAT_2: HEAT_2: HEAT_2 [Gemmataceae bacterium]|nr:pbs lyase heat-like repeat domain protein : PBS lyase HEAT-like repeat domain protein OS=Rhodopirellula sp. SWK7 GN=RRSWK_06263 PE=4 SV=1: HEAT_2: HEAT_2: HEAT_2 [Gemmataceae bacterium]VTU00270.1 pbs lyase heat-like repeat domain protein : PBS lyase HEAT-like repeat domain protein OS=Rhodopirellula sp. SWK7 GN=RRSWK_06263 PE=4 SV=1: HEAT_2: HEAT_2: HEAT_2 [Gemmataceae bacterium]
MKYLLSAFLALTAALSALAAPPDLKGKTLEATFTELLPAIGKPDTAAQQRWQDICFAVGAPGNEKLREDACKLMAAKLDDKTPKPARLWFLAQLQRIGNDESVDAIAAAAGDTDDEVREAAVRALAGNASPKATAKLTEKLADAKGGAKVGLLNAIGRRGDASAVAAVAKELTNSDEAAAVAAARALGRVPGPEAAGALAGARAAAKGAVRAAVADSLLSHADRLLKAGKATEAAAVYKELGSKDEAKPVRLAALRGTIQSSGDKAGELVLEVLGSDDAGARAIAVGQIEGLSAGALKTLAASLDKLTAANRVLVVTAIAARGEKSLLPVAAAAAKDADPAVKRAGVVALGRLGDAGTVDQLLELVSSKDAAAGVATEALAALPAEGVNEKLLAALDAEKTPAKTVALIGVLERRKASAAVPALLKAATDADAGVRTAAFNGLKSLAGPEHIPGMIAAFLKANKGKDRDQAEQAIVAVALQIANAEKRAEPVLAAVKDTAKDRAADMLPLLGRIGGTDAKKVLREALAGTDPALHDAAVAGLCNWPDATANDELLALAEKGKDAEKLRALQALIRVNTVLVDRTPEERLATLAVVKKAMELSTRDDERRAILEGLGNVRHIETLHYVLPYLDQPALAEAACKGVTGLAHSKNLREPNKAEFAKALDRVIATTKDKALADRAKGYKNAQ